MQIFFDILGYLGAVFVAGVSLPELIRVYRTKKTSHISFIWYGILLTGCFLFLTNGLYFIFKNLKSVDNFLIAVTVANVLSFLFTGTVLLNKVYNIVLSKKEKISEQEYELIRAKKKDRKE